MKGQNYRAGGEDNMVVLYKCVVHYIVLNRRVYLKHIAQ
jgi:hypothetical protein